MKNLVYFLLTLLIFSATSCGSGQKHNEPRQTKQKVDSPKPEKTASEEETFKAGRLYPEVRCGNHPEYSYALYLPKAYNDERRWPVIFLFDAHARGTLPVEKYKALANKFGVILACSNNSKNGLNANIINMISYNFIEDIQSRFGIDEKSVYTGGFSGGARIAVEVADMNKAVSGVIGCGAGVPDKNFIGRIDFDYFLCAGNKDFNYKELKQLSTELKNAGVNYYFSVFDGKHEWPQEDIFEQGLYFLMISGNAGDSLNADGKMVKDYLSFEKNNLQKAFNTNDIVEQVHIYERMAATLNKITNTTEYQKKLKILYTTKIWHEHEKNLKKALANEAAMQKYFMQNFDSRGIKWWKTQIDELYSHSHDAPSKEERLSYTRLLNYLSLLSYLYLDNSLKNNELAKAQKYLFIYQKVDPDNTEVYYLQAVYYAMQGKNALSLSSLQTAVKKGFDDFERIAEDPHFHFSEAEMEKITEAK